MQEETCKNVYQHDRLMLHEGSPTKALLKTVDLADFIVGYSSRLK